MNINVQSIIFNRKFHCNILDIPILHNYIKCSVTVLSLQTISLFGASLPHL